MSTDAVAYPIRIRTLGSPAVVDRNGDPVSLPVGKPLALLAFLHTEDRSVSRAELAGIFWPDAAPEKARGSVRQALWLLRRAAGEGLFRSEDPVELAPEAVTTDLAELHEALAAPRELERALDLWKAAPFQHLLLPDLPEWERWTDRIRTEAEQRLASALAEEAAGAEPERALALLEEACRIQPYRSALHLAGIDHALAAHDFEGADRLIGRARTEFPDDEALARELEARMERLQLLRRRSYEGRDQTRGLSLEFVGRTEAYSHLVKCWRVARSGTAHTALLLGEAGIGKSRLACQVVALAEAEGGRPARVKAEDGEERLAWAFLSELFRQLMGLSGAAGIGHDSERVIRSLLPGLGDPGTLDPLPDAADGAGVSNGGPRAPPNPAALSEALADLVSAVSDDDPLVLFLDDVHWADSMSRAVILRTLRRLEQEPVFVLVASRTGGGDPELTRWLRLVERTDAVRVTRLEPLSEAEVAEAVSLLTEFSDPNGAGRVLAEIHRVCRGNPLFLVETLDLLRKRRILEPVPAAATGVDRSSDDERWVLHMDRVPERLPVPATVRELLELKLQGLSPEAVRLVQELLEGRGPLPPDDLQAGSGLGAAAFTGALQTLLERGVLRWTPDDRLAFAHDEMQAVARSRLEPRAVATRGLRSRWAGWSVAMGVAAMFLLWVLATTVGLPTGSSDGAPLYGGGSVFLVYPEAVWEVTPMPNRPPSEWAAREVLDAPPDRRGRILGIQTLADGRMAWFQDGRSLEDAPWITMRPSDGPEEVLVRTDGDDFFGDAFPDGRTIVYRSQDLESSSYRHDLYRMDLITGQSARIFRADPLSRPRVSPDGRRIAFLGLDQLYVLSPDGRLLEQVEMAWAMGFEWCGGSDVAVLAHEDGVPALFTVDLVSGEREAVPTSGIPGTWFTCSPDGSLIAYASVIDAGGVRHLVFDRSSGTEYELAAPVERSQARILWAGAPLTPVPLALRFASDSLQVEWGDVLELEVSLELSDGTATEADVGFQSDDPAVASVSETGVLFANSPGTTRIRAEWDGWLVGETDVAVTGTHRAGTLVEDRFETLSHERWKLVGWPVPTAGTANGEPVLLLNGDGRYEDGMIEREPRAYPEGVTLEVEFQLPLTRVDHQRVLVCLMEADLPEGGEDSVELHHLIVYQRVCFRYPRADLLRFDPEEASLGTEVTGMLPVSVSDHLPSDGWIHVGLQLRADGEVTLYLNGELARRFPVRLRNDPETLWRVGLFGHSVETRAMMRNLALWPGLRFER